MSKVNMVKFSKLTGYDYEFIRAVAKQHGSWKSLVEHVQTHGGINGLFGFYGFITYDENYEFFKPHQQYIHKLLVLREGGLDFGDFKDVANNISAMMGDNHVDVMNRRDQKALLGGTHDHYYKWYTQPIWYMLRDIGFKLKTIME